MRKLSYLMLVLALVLPLAIPFAPALAQESATVLAALETYNANLPAGYGNVTVADLSIEIIEKPDLMLVDVRQPEEYAESHIPGAFNIPLRELAQNLDKLPLDAEMVVYCGSGFRSSIAMTSLQVLGYTNVRNMAGGYATWLGEEFATTTDVVEAESVGAPELDAEVLAAVDAQLAGLPEGWGSVKAEDLNIELIENPPALLIDVRTPTEWEEKGYIAGAVNQPLEQFMSFAGEWPEDKATNIVIYCAAGHRGNMAATLMRTLGYTNVRNLAGGFNGWATAGLTIEGGAPAPAAQPSGDAVTAALEAYNANLPAGYGNVTVTDLSIEIIEKPDLMLVDVRQPEEYAESHIPGAFNIPLRELAQNLDKLPLDAEMVVYCGSGFRSSIAMTSLQVLGYTNVRNMAGGFGAWQGEEFATTTDVVEAESVGAPELDAEVLAAVDAQLAGLPEGWGSVKPEDFNIELIENPPALLIDVRTPTEWEEKGYIAGAVNQPLEQFMSFAGEWPEDKATNIVIYCAAGHRGNMAATLMRTLGYTNVRNLAGGFNGWATAGLPFEGGAPAPAAAAEFDPVALWADYLAGLPASFNAVRVDDAAAQVEANPDLVIVDVRTVDEYAEGHIAGAINIPLTEVTDHLDMLPNLDEPMLVVCGSGHRSAMAMTALNLLGYDGATSLFAGMGAWTGAGYEVTTEPTEAEAGAAPEIAPEVFEMVDAYMKAIPAGYYTIKAEDLNLALIENPPALVDVRTNSEVEQGIIGGATHIELREFMNRMSDWPEDKTQPVVIYALGHRSVIAMMAMQMLGYEDVRSLAGGVNAWTAAGYPLVTE